MTVIEESMFFYSEYITPLEVVVEESLAGVAMIVGTLLSEGISKNGNLYMFEELDQIAKSAKGAPIYFGTMRKINPNTGLLTENMHQNLELARVGEIFETWVDKVARKIKFRAHLINNPNFPNLIEQVKKGWGISIGGKGFGQKLVDAAGRIITKIMNMNVTHVQLLEPDTPRGQNAAQVEDSEKKFIEESFEWVEEEKPTVTHIHISL